MAAAHGGHRGPALNEDPWQGQTEGVGRVGLRPVWALRRAHAGALHGRGRVPPGAARRHWRNRPGCLWRHLGARNRQGTLGGMRQQPGRGAGGPQYAGAAILPRGPMRGVRGGGRHVHGCGKLHRAGLGRALPVEVGHERLRSDRYATGYGADATQHAVRWCARVTRLRLHLAVALHAVRIAPGSLQLGGLARQVVGLGRGELQLGLHLGQLADRLEQVALRLGQARLQLLLLCRALRWVLFGASSACAERAAAGASAARASGAPRGSGGVLGALELQNTAPKHCDLPHEVLHGGGELLPPHGAALDVLGASRELQA
mmetsp:Transcript_38713/g.115680  ORF Transcript_38713/g.115680 Transcript_38713/m.115680 type:complete len:317 (+) Transcript_38713:280-1230(+)